MAIPQVRRLTLQDLDTVIQIQGNCYSTSFIEPRDAMQQHIASGQPCWLAERDGVPAGYLLAAHLGADGPPSPISLGATDRPPPASDANCLYLHDLAIQPALQGTGISQALWGAAMDHLMAHRQLLGMALVAVQSSRPFWAKLGFRVLEDLPAGIATKLASYGPDAVYMWRPREIE
ncbi:MAG: GNAT family N-acetyltransferase [Aquabacterium sp.]